MRIADANCPFQSFLNLVDLAKSKRQGKFILATNNKDNRQVDSKPDKTQVTTSN